MIHTDIVYNELAFSFSGRVPEAAQRVQAALTALGVQGILEGLTYLRSSTAVHVLVAGREGRSVLTGDPLGQVSEREFDELFNDRLWASLRPAAVFLNDECVYGTPQQYDAEVPPQSWLVIAGTSLRPEHLVVAMAKDKGARWSFWQSEGCGFARYDGDDRYHSFAFPQEAGVVVALIPRDRHIDVSVFARGQRVELEFSEETQPVTRFPEGSAAAEQLGIVWNDWFELGPETFETLAQSTGNPRAAAELRLGLDLEAGLPLLEQMLRNLGISRRAMEYTQSGNAPATAQAFEPRGTLDRIRIIRDEIERRTGSRPSFFESLRMLRRPF